MGNRVGTFLDWWQHGKQWGNGAITCSCVRANSGAGGTVRVLLTLGHCSYNFNGKSSKRKLLNLNPQKSRTRRWLFPSFGPRLHWTSEIGCACSVAGLWPMIGPYLITMDCAVMLLLILMLLPSECISSNLLSSNKPKKKPTTNALVDSKCRKTCISKVQYQ